MATNTLLPTTIAGSLPKPGWLAEPQALWAPWKLDGDLLREGKRDAVRLVLREQEQAGIDVVTSRLDRLKRGLKGRADVRSTSAKWAWVEYVLAQGGEAEGLAVIDVVAEGGGFAAYKRAFTRLAKARPAGERRRSLAIAAF